MAIHTVQVTSEAKASPTITDFTTMSAAWNIPQGERSRGSSASAPSPAGDGASSGAIPGVGSGAWATSGSPAGDGASGAASCPTGAGAAGATGFPDRGADLGRDGLPDRGRRSGNLWHCRGLLGGDRGRQPQRRHPCDGHAATTSVSLHHTFLGPHAA